MIGCAHVSLSHVHVPLPCPPTLAAASNFPYFPKHLPHRTCLCSALLSPSLSLLRACVLCVACAASSASLSVAVVAAARPPKQHRRLFASSLVSNEPDRDIDTSACLTSELNCIPPLIVDLPKQLVIFPPRIFRSLTLVQSIYHLPYLPQTRWCGSPSTCLPTVSTCQKNNKNSTTPSTTQPPSSRTNELGTDGDDFFFGLESVPQPRPGPSPSSASARPTRQLMLAAHLRCSPRVLLDNSSRTRSAILIAPIHRSRAFLVTTITRQASLSDKQSLLSNCRSFATTSNCMDRNH